MFARVSKVKILTYLRSSSVGVFVCMCDLGHLRVRVCGPRCHSGSSLYIYRVYLRHSFRVVPRLLRTKRGQNDHFALTRARAGRRRRTLAVHRRDSAQGHGHHQWPCPGHVSEIRRPSSQTGEQARAPTQCYGVDGADQAARKPGAHHRYHGRVASWQGCLCCVWPFARPGCDHHHCTR